jgi:hypothetical protein
LLLNYAVYDIIKHCLNCFFRIIYDWEIQRQMRDFLE